MNKIIQGLWIGNRLSAMEQLCPASFMCHGHEFHLYTYGDVENAPPGTILKDAETILPAAMIFQYKKHKSYAAFANYFRYKLLLEKGGWWVDMDMVCLRPFDFEEEYVFSSEINKGRILVNIGAIKVPPHSQLAKTNWEVCCSKSRHKLAWGETGPRLMYATVRQLRLTKYVKPVITFCPVHYEHWSSVLDPDVELDFEDDRIYAIHLWNEMWRRAGKDKDAKYHPHCIYEQLRARYL